MTLFITQLLRQLFNTPDIVVFCAQLQCKRKKHRAFLLFWINVVFVFARNMMKKKKTLSKFAPTIEIISHLHITKAWLAYESVIQLNV